MNNAGKKANTEGKQFEAFVERCIEESGYTKTTAKEFFKLRCLKQPIFAAQCEIGVDIYSKTRRVDFILYDPDKWVDCLVLQCKWQAAKGSVEEKYPYEVLSIQLNNFDTIIVIDGGGFSPGAVQWLKSQAGKNKLLHVFNQSQLQGFTTRGQL